MNQSLKAPKIVIILSLTLITIIFWVGFEVYRSLTTKPTPPVPPHIIEPINPVLDAAALSNIQTRIHLNDSQIGITQPPVQEVPEEFVASPSATPTVSPEPTNVATSSGNLP